MILVAVSGGGTRAALYGAAVFRGLAEFGALEDVQLCSGVSGGSTAIAHLAAHRAELIGPKRNAQAWSEYKRVMSAPFIDEVLCGTLEWRISFGTRMGTLLDESFHRHVQPGVPLSGGAKFKDAPIGVIFNTTLTGSEFQPSSSDATNAGSRLIVTNLATDQETFPSKGFPGAEAEFLPYIIVQDPEARLATGAALSANFPPVFPNTAVDLTGQGGLAERHWVTDGGVAENRGDISLLYVLLHALEREAARDPSNPSNPRTPPPVLILIAEATGVSLDFSQDRGIGSMMGASGKFSNQLLVELLDKIKGAYKRLKGTSLSVHYLPMPLVLRSRGGVGTHWRMPEFVTLANPRDHTKTMTIKGSLATQLIMDLYVAPPKRQGDPADETLDQARRWIEGEGTEPRFNEHRRAWNRLEKALSELHFTEKPP